MNKMLHLGNATTWAPGFLSQERTPEQGHKLDLSALAAGQPSPGLLAEGEINNYETENTSAPSDVYIFTPKQLQKSDMIEYRVGMILLTYVLPVIIFGGTVGNVLSFLVLVRKRMRSTSLYFYLAVLAVADTAVLYLSAFKTWLRLLTGIEALHFSAASCKIFMFLFLFSLHMSAWLIVFITLERFTVVWFPFKASTRCSMRRSAILVTSLCLVLVAYNLHVMWTMDLQLQPRGNGTYRKMCSPDKHNYFMDHVFEYLKLVSYSILPFAIVFSFNLGIIFKVYQQTRGQRSSSWTEKMEVNRTQAQNRTTYMLLTVTFVWLVLTAPFTMWSLIASDNPSTSKEAARNFLSKIICFLLMYLNHSINFYLYCLVGKRFRRELRELFCVWLSYKLGRRRRSLRTFRTPILNSREREMQQGLNANSDPKETKGHIHMYPLIPQENVLHHQ